MFLPGRSVEQERQQKQTHYQRVEELIRQTFDSKQIDDACTITVQEVACGDPACSPIDTIVCLTFNG